MEEELVVQGMAKWNPLALKILLWVVGVLLVVSSAAEFIGVNLVPGNTGIASLVTGPVAGIAFGAGVMIAGFDPVANVSWVRAVILYSILEIVYQIFTAITIGAFDVLALVVGILIAAAILVLYPNRPALWLQGTMSSGAHA